MSDVRRCKRGHAMTGANVVYRTYKGAKSDRCKKCEAERSAKRYARIREDGGRTEECDCGQSKSPLAESCDACAFLDGRPTAPVHGMIISALRTSGEMSMNDLLDAVYGHGRRDLNASMHRALSDMIKDGRVQRRMSEVDPFMASKRLNGRDFIAPSGGTKYVYRLTAPARGELRRAS